MVKRRLIIGDIHASYDKLISVLKKAAFNPSSDMLYSVGDIVDRGDKPVETIDFLMGLAHFYPVLGNHDGWLENYLHTSKPDPSWIMRNGGDVTVIAIRRQSREWRERVRTWLRRFPVIRVEEKDIIIHGGIPGVYNEKELMNIAGRGRPHPLVKSYSYDDLLEFSDEEEEDYDYLEDFLWDRDYLYNAMYEEGIKTAFIYIEKRMKPVHTDKTIWIGHTPLREGVPYFSEKYHLAAIDTGSYYGKLTLVDMDTREYWQA